MKKRQHYIWRHYLKPWVKNKKIWCLHNKKIFNTSLENIGQEKYFYKAVPLNNDELTLLELYINQLHPTAQKTNYRSLEVYVTSSSISEESRKEGIENYHTLIEANAINVLNCLHKKDLSFLSRDIDKFNFSSYLGFQYTRTKKMQDNLIKMFEFPEFKLNVSNTVRPHIFAKAMSLIFADTIGNWIYSKANVFFIENKTEECFITGDQPIININASYLKPGELVNELKLYYPVSPKIAILIKDNEDQENITDVTYLNDLISKFCHTQLYANSSEGLKIYNN